MHLAPPEMLGVWSLVNSSTAMTTIIITLLLLLFFDDKYDQYSGVLLIYGVSYDLESTS